jgi:hypothetical protein
MQMPKTYAEEVLNAQVPSQSKLTPLQKFERFIETHPGLPGVDRGVLLIKLMSRTQPFKMTPANQAKFQTLSRRDVKRARQLAISSGGWRATKENWLERTETDGKKLDAIFRSIVGLKMNILTLVISRAASKTVPDYRVQISRHEMARRFHVHPGSIVPMVKELEDLGLLGVERTAGQTSIYWPKPLEGMRKPGGSATGAVKSGRKIDSGASVEDILRQLGIAPAFIVESFAKNVIRPTGTLFSENRVEKVRGAVGLYRQIETELKASKRPEHLKYDAGGPLQIMRDYVAWLLEQDWAPMARMGPFDINSKAFNQFRRYQAEYIHNGLDPITGKYR